MNTRDDILRNLREESDVSVLIVGGGVNGIATFRDLALQDVDVLLIDKVDFCSGASAASSHMAHGGLRYLENAEFRLVREALHERNRLLKNAPHCIFPLPTTIPIFNWFGGVFNAPLKFLRLRDKPGHRGAIVIKMGLTLYDIFARQQRSMPTHSFYSRKRSLEIRPDIHPDIVCTASYYDAWIKYPERLCLEMILDTEAAHDNAAAINYMALTGAHGDTVTLTDELTQETYTVKPQIVVNAGGPWIDFVNRSMDQETCFIGGTKGSHLVIDNQDLFEATAGSEMFFENEDGRITLFFPFINKVLAGTTDIPIGNPDDAAVSEDEVQYILESIKMVFPNIEIDRSQIVFQFTGVRPLPASDAATPGQISRDHSIKVIEPGQGVNFPVLSLVGGKWTTFRAFGEVTADMVLKRLGKSRQADTTDLPIGGGKDYPFDEAAQHHWLDNLHSQTGLDHDRLSVLFDRYGTWAANFAAFMAADDDADLQHLPDYSRREIEYLVTHEKVVHLDDFLLRRSLVSMLGGGSHAMIAELADVVGDALGWDTDHRQAEVERTTHILTTNHKMML